MLRETGVNEISSEKMYIKSRISIQSVLVLCVLFTELLPAGDTELKYEWLGKTCFFCLNALRFKQLHYIT
jgi:hypothetical protein